MYYVKISLFFTNKNQNQKYILKLLRNIKSSNLKPIYYLINIQQKKAIIDKQQIVKC